MRISFITNINSIHAQRWIKPLISSGHQINIFSYRSNPIKFSGVSNHIDLTEIINVQKFRFLYWGIWLRRYLSKYQPDLLHSHQIQAAGWIGALTDYHPFVISAWGSDLLVEPNKSIFRRLLVKFVLRKCDYLTVPSKHMYNAAINLGFDKEKMQIIPWGVETDVFNNIPDDRADTREVLNIPQNTPVIFCPRRIANICNIDIVVEAVSNLIDLFPNILLVLLMFNPEETYLRIVKQRIASLDLIHHVLWLPEQNTSQEMARLYRMSDMVISIPSSEGYGFTVYEAMSCVTPIIISDLDVYKEEIIDGVHAIKVPPRDVEKTSKAALSILQDKELKKSLAENSMSISINHSVDKRIEQVENFYIEIQNQHRYS